MTPSERKVLGRNNGLASRETVYETPDALEVESLDHYEITRKRVMYDDILLVTFHREIGNWFIAGNLLVALFFMSIFGMIFAFLPKKETVPMLIGLGVMMSPFLLAALIRTIFRVDVVTVFGRRSKASLRYSFRKRRAREVYGKICAAARRAQETAVC